MAKKMGILTRLKEFYDTASADSAALVTDYAVACNKVAQRKAGKVTTTQTKKAEPEKAVGQ